MDKATLGDIETARMLIEIGMEIIANRDGGREGGEICVYLASAGSYLTHAITGVHSCDVAENLVAQIYTHIAIHDAMSDELPL